MNNRPWLKSYDPEVPHSLACESRLIPSILEKSAREFPSRNAMIFFGLSVTYRELWEYVEQFSLALIDTGVREKERVLLFLPNCPHFIIAYYAALRAGAIVVPANPLYSEKELEFQIRDSGADTLITLDVLFPQVKKVMSAVQLSGS